MILILFKGNTDNMKSQLYISDILLLSKLFFGSKCDLILNDPFDGILFDCQIRDEEDNRKVVLVNTRGAIDPFQKGNCILDFSGSSREGFKHRLRFDFINNPDGTMRWLYPNGKPKLALSFFNTSSLRAKCISFVIRALGFMRLGALVKSGELTAYSNEPFHFANEASCTEATSYTVFTGTKGKNRNMVIAAIENTDVKAFIKIPVDSMSIPSLGRELDVVDQIDCISPKTFVYPKLLSDRSSMLSVLSNVKPKTSFRESKFTEKHEAVILELLHKTSKQVRLIDTSFWDKINSNISLLRRVNYEAVLVGQLRKIIEKIDPNEIYYMGFSHGDFTPWNIYSDDEKLFIYDWEYSRVSASAFYDVFHFHYQNGILSEGMTDKQILTQLSKVFKTKGIMDFVESNNIDLEAYHTLYLLYYISSQLCDYAYQDSLSVQNEKQLSQWKRSVSRISSSIEFSSHREAFVYQFDLFLMPRDHAYLKLDCENLTNLGELADLDIAIQQKDYVSILNFCKNNSLIQRIHEIRKSFMTTLEVSFFDGSFLSIDLIYKFKRKNLTFLDIDDVLKCAEINKDGIKVPSLCHDLEYALLFYGLNGADVPFRYRRFFSRKLSLTPKNILSELIKKYDLRLNQEEFWRHSSDRRTKLIQKVKMIPENKGLSWLKGVSRYLNDTVVDLLNRQGFVITFSGIDGAGKTTIIDNVKDKVSKKFRRDVVLLRHRPGILPILSSLKYGKMEAEMRASMNKPRQGKNGGFFSSLLRFSYYFSDYFVGQFYVYLKYVLRGKIVIYDRYYFDFINDPERSNVAIGGKLIKRLYGVLMKPKMNYFLYADPDVIWSRKQETDRSAISDITRKYMELFKDYNEQYVSSKYVSINNVNIGDTISTVLNRLS